MADGKPCHSLFASEYYIDISAQASFLTRQQLDIVLLGSVMSTTAVDKDVVCGRHKPTKTATVNRVHEQWIPAVQEYLQLSVWLGEALGACHFKKTLFPMAFNGLEV